MDIGTRIKAAREAKGMSQVDLARALGITAQSVYGWESGRSLPKGMTRISRICEALGLKTSDLTDDRLERDVARASLDLPALLRAELPPNLHSYIDRVVELQGTRARMAYMSRKVCVLMPRAIGSPERGMMPFGVQNALYKLTVLRHSFGDYPLSDRHYLAAVVDLDDQDLSIPAPILAEARILGLGIMQFASMRDVAEEIIRLEAAPTDVEEAFKSAQNYEPDEPFEL